MPLWVQEFKVFKIYSRMKSFVFILEKGKNYAKHRISTPTCQKLKEKNMHKKQDSSGHVWIFVFFFIYFVALHFFSIQLTKPNSQFIPRNTLQSMYKYVFIVGLLCVCVRVSASVYAKMCNFSNLFLLSFNIRNVVYCSKL